MSELYLIAHKVRGEPAFDIATQMECPHCKGDYDIDRDEESLCHECDDQGYWWIIPTSGHRAYPYWNCALVGLFEDANIWPQSIDMPEGIPDHYRTRAEPTIDLATALGITTRRATNVPIKRRF